LILIVLLKSFAFGIWLRMNIFNEGCSISNYTSEFGGFWRFSYPFFKLALSLTNNY